MTQSDQVRPRRFGLADVAAGSSVALVVIPQSLAYAELAGMPAYTGLYAAALPLVAAAPFASSRYLQTGPVAITALLSFGALAQLATPGSPEYIGLAMMLAFLVGIIRLGLGLLNGGGITNYMSPPVILGFTSAATLLIVASQSHTIFGVRGTSDELIPRLIDVLSSPTDWNWATLGLAGMAAVAIVGGRKISTLFPGVLLAVIIGMIVASQTSYSGELVGSVPASFPPISLALPWSSTLDLLLPALIIAVIGFAEPTAIARTMALQDRERWDASRELVSQGVANMVSGISGGFAVGGSFSRSGINRLAGARTRWSGAVTGVIVLAFMPFAEVLSDLPRAVLGATVVVGVIGLIRIPEMIRLARVSWGQAAVAWSTAIATLVLSPRIDIAILIGILAAASIHIYREASRTRTTTVHDAGVLEIRLGGVLFYGSAGSLEAALSDAVASNPETTSIVLDLARLGRIDYSGILMLQSFAQQVREAGLEVSVANVPRHAEGIFARAGGI